MNVSRSGPAVLAFVLLILLPNQPSLFAQSLPTMPAPEPPAVLAPAADRNFRVDVLTVDPGDEAYSAWGHTALRIYDRNSGQDVVFDYGMFDFSDDFFVRFLRNQPAYLLWVSSLDRTLRLYRRLNRRIYAQQIHLSDEEAQRIFRRLVFEAQPQNRVYLYHHYRNNCTTKIRDLFDEELWNNDLKRTYGDAYNGKSWRSMANAMLVDNPPYWMAVTLIQGSFVDTRVSKYQEMYLPLDFMRILDDYRERHPERLGPIVEVQDERIPRAEPPTTYRWTMLFLVWGVLILFCYGLPAWFAQRRPFRIAGAVFRYLWYIGAGITGTLLLLLWLFTNHDSLDNNLNVLAFFPLLLFMPPFLLVLRYIMPDVEARHALHLKLHLGLAAVPALGILLAITTISPQITALVYLVPSLIIQLLIYAYFRRAR